MLTYPRLLIAHLIVLGLAATIAQGQKLPPVDAYLAKVNVSYETNLVKIKEGDQASRKTLLKKYAYNLLEIERKLKETGQLEPLLVLRKEISRMKKMGSLQGVETEGSPDLQRLFTSYNKLFADIDLHTSQQLYNLSGKSDTSLANLQESYTRADRIEDAVKVKEAREAFLERPDVLEALAILKVANDKKAEQTLQPSSPENWKPVRPGAAQAAPSIANKFSGSDKKRIGDRYDAFIEALLNAKENKMDDVVSLVNPEETKQVGQQLIALTFAAFVPMVQFADKAGAEFRTGKIKLDPDGTSAIQIPYYAGPGDNKELDPVHWVKVDGDWYLRLGKK